MDVAGENKVLEEAVPPPIKGGNAPSLSLGITNYIHKTKPPAIISRRIININLSFLVVAQN